MKKKLLFKMLALIWAMTITNGLFAQSLAIIGEEEASTHPVNVPIDFTFYHSYSQTIYLNTELAPLANSKINKIGYYLSESPTKGTIDDFVRIYIAPTDKENFSSVEDWFPTNQLRVCYEGQFTQTDPAPCWIEVEFDTPYLYDGTTHLVIAVEMPQKRSWWEGVSFYGFKTTTLDNRILYVGNDGAAIDTNSPPTGRSNETVPRTKLYGEELSGQPEIMITIPEVDFDFVEVTGRPVSRSLEITNAGKADLIITGVNNITLPFSVQTGTITLPSLATSEIEFTFTPDLEGSFVQEVTLVHNAINDPTISLKGVGYANGSLLESFESVNFPPDYWRTVNNNWTAGTITYHGKQAAHLSTISDTLITPLITGSLKLYAMQSTSGGELKLLSSSDLINWELHLDTPVSDTFGEYSHEFFSPVYVGITGRNILVDMITADQVTYPEKDLLFTSWSVPAGMQERTPAEFSVTVKNWGKAAESVYTLLLKNAETDALLYAAPGEEIAPLEEKTISFQWDPLPEVTAVYLEIALEGDEDLTTNFTPDIPVSITSFLGVLTIPVNEIDFGIVKSSVEPVERVVKVSNTGIAPLTMTGFSVNSPFGVQAPVGTIYAEAEEDITIILNPTESGVYEEKLIITHTGVGETTEILLKGEVLKKGALYEDFEEEEFPSFMWTITGNGWQRRAFALAFEGKAAAYLNTSDPGSYLITPRLKVESADELSFYTRSWTSSNEVKLEVLTSSDLVNWTPLLEKTATDLTDTYQLYTVPLQQAGEYYIAFTGLKEILLDLIRGPEVIYPEHDLLLHDWNGPAQGAVNDELIYTVTIKNQGKQDENDYIIRLMNGEETLLTLPGEAIPSLAEKELSFVWVPRHTGEYRLRVIVEAADDEIPENNISDEIVVQIGVENSRIITVGTTEASTSDLPLYRNWKYSLSEVIYYKEEMNIPVGASITRVGYNYYWNSTMTEDHTTPVRMWIGTTGKETLLNELVPTQDLRLVYDRELTFEAGEYNLRNPGTVWVELDQPIVYEEGNLVIIIETNRIPTTNDYLSGQLYFYGNTSDKEARSVNYYDDATALSPESGLEYSQMKNTLAKYPTTLFAYELPVVQVSGRLVDEQDNPMPHVEVTLSSDHLLYTTITGEDASFSLDVYGLNREYTLTVKTEEQETDIRTFTVGRENIDLGTIRVEPPGDYCNLTITVTTATGVSIAGATGSLENNYTGMKYNTQFTENGQWQLENLLKGTYTLIIEHGDLLPYINNELHLNSATTLEVELKENIVTPYGLQSTVTYDDQTGKGTINFTWNNDLDAFFDDFESYDDFSISFAPWTGLDMDGGIPIRMDITYPNYLERQYAIIFNPLYTNPIRWGEYPFMPYSGYKYVVFSRVENVPNNDWLIAPKKMIRQGDIVSFMAKSLGVNFAKENFRVAVSDKGNTNPNDFTVISPYGRDESVGDTWTRFQYDLSSYAGKEVYVAINYTSDSKQMMMIDDFFMGQPSAGQQARNVRTIARAGSEETYPRYIVYLDEEEITTTADIYYTFTAMAGGDYRLGVKAIYGTGETETIYTDVHVDDETAFAKLTVNVIANDNKPVDKVAISFSNPTEGITYNKTIQSGKVEIPYMKKGEYYVSLTTEGYEEYTHYLTLAEDHSLTIVLQEIIITPYNLTVTPENEDEGTITASFRWNQDAGWTDSFEEYDDFTTDLAPWTTHDFNNGYSGVYELQVPTNQGSIIKVDFPGTKEVSLPMVFNPSRTDPAIDGIDLSAAPRGSKYVVMFSPVMAKADAWLISPLQTIKEDYILKFLLKAFPLYLDVEDRGEEVRIAISEENDPDSFVEIDKINPYNSRWDEYEYDLSEYIGKDIYIAFHYTSVDRFFIQLDEVYVGPKDVNVYLGSVLEYEVFLNDNLVAKPTENNYQFKGLQPNTKYKAGVKAIYVSGESELAEIEFTTPEWTAVSEETLRDITIYPTQVTDGIIWIEAGEAISDVRLFNVEGQLQFITTGEDNTAIHLDVKGLSPGVYFVKVATRTQQKIVKVIIVD